MGDKEKVTIKVRNGFAIQIVDNIDKWESKNDIQSTNI